VTAILGVNCFSHDTAAALVIDGEPVAVGEQERFDRVVHTTAFPDDAIAFCLEQAGCPISEVDLVAFAHQPWRDFVLGASDALRRLAPKRLAAQTYVDARLVARERRFRRRWGWRKPILHVGHHLAHGASAFFASPFDDAAVLTVDRGGDFLSTMLARGRGSSLHVLAQVRNPHSLGEVYSAVTGFLGFRAGIDEGKVMGLAPYGSAREEAAVRELVRLLPGGLFEVDLSWFGYHREAGPVSRRFRDRFGEPRAPEGPITPRDQDLAFAVQRLVEEAGLHLARGLRARTGADRLALAGGVALNSVMNGRLLEESGFTDLFIQPAASDAGNALGAALWAWHHVVGGERRYVMEHPFLGKSWSDAECRRALEARGVPFRLAAERAEAAAELIAAGKVVGWFQGRAEVGPRALGARSILADPRPPEMRDHVNSRVKRREWFRPFAPAVLAERGPRYFRRYVPSPFMLLVLPVAPEARSCIPAVTHVDGTARLQSVTEGFHRDFYRLIAAFERRSGVGVVLNTSFNLRGEPMVHRPEEAVATYLASDMDALVMGPYVAVKDGAFPAGT
jgi:carbamoyltransferase